MVGMRWCVGAAVVAAGLAVVVGCAGPGEPGRDPSSPEVQAAASDALSVGGLGDLDDEELAQFGALVCGVVPELGTAGALNVWVSSDAPAVFGLSDDEALRAGLALIVRYCPEAPDEALE